MDAIKTLLEKLQTYKEKEDLYEIAKCLKNIGIFYMREDVDKALEYFYDALKSIKKFKINSSEDNLKVLHLKSEIFYDIGMIYKKIKKNKKAMRLFYSASLICNQTGNNTLAAAIASAIISLDAKKKYKTSSKEKKTKNIFKFQWVYLILSILPWIIILIIIFIISN
ncbi:MAG: hypothetical protein ACTSPY_06590 [Candidatus Helarchaeota archaeon]